MRTAAPHITLKPAQIDAFAASLRAWALRVVAWLADALGVFGHGLRDEVGLRLRECARYAELTIFLHAAWRLRYFRRRPCAFEAPSRGQPRQRSLSRRRRYYRIPGLNRGSFAQRAHRIAALLRDPEVEIRRIMRRLRRGRHGVAPGATPPKQALYLCSPARVAAFADTS